MKKLYDDKDEEPSEEINIYSKNGRESLLDDDELDAFEEAFMEGYEAAVI